MNKEGLEAGLDYRTPSPYRIIESAVSDEEPELDIKKFGFKWTHPVQSIRDILNRKRMKYFIPPGTKPEEVFKVF